MSEKFHILAVHQPFKLFGMENIISPIFLNFTVWFFHVSFPLDGKNKAVEVQALYSLMPLLKYDDTDVRANSSGAVMV